MDEKKDQSDFDRCQAHRETTPAGTEALSANSISPTEDLERYRENLRDEINGAALYRALADIEKNPKLAEVYRRLASVEDRHARIWEKRLKDAGENIPSFGISWRTRTLIWLARHFGIRSVLPTVLSMEESDSRSYALDHDPVVGEIRADEFSHARLIRTISQSGHGGMEGGAMARMEGRHRLGTGNALRAAVLGANDGLVSNLSLVMGVAGAALSEMTILITGIAGLLAGSISMALGEWLSVKSSRELYERQIQTERQEIEMSPVEEAEELALIYQAKGLSEEHAKKLSEQIMSDETTALETMAREELGIDPHQLGGSAREAAVTSFFLFACGAIIPVFPFFFLEGSPAIVVAFVSSLLGLFAIGAGTSLFTGRTVLFSGFRQLLFGAAAALITYSIGRILGVTLT